MAVDRLTNPAGSPDRFPVTYTNPSGNEVIDTSCPKHASPTVQIASGTLGAAFCGHKGCGEALVAHEERNARGDVTHRKGRPIKGADGDTEPTGETGGQKLHRASTANKGGKGTGAKKAAAPKNTARKGKQKVDSRGGKGVAVAEES